MSKYGHRTHNWFEAIVNKLGGEECAEKFLRGEIVVQQFAPNPILRCISDGADLVIPACDGSHTLANAKKVFKSYIDSNFKNWGLDKKGESTKETPVVVHEMIKDATFAQIFSSFGVDLGKLCFTQHQVEVFCENHPDWLRIDGYGTFFLTKKNWKNSATIGNLFVAVVVVDFDGLFVNAFRFEYDNMWGADYQHHLVVPQLET